MADLALQRLGGTGMHNRELRRRALAWYVLGVEGVLPLILPPNISPAIAGHILQGHSASSSDPTKTKFPPDWSDQMILDITLDIATDSSLPLRPTYGGRKPREGKRRGITVRVVFDTTGRVITSDPIKSRTGLSL